MTKQERGGESSTSLSSRLKESLLIPASLRRLTPERRFQAELALAFAYFLLCVVSLTSITELLLGTRALGLGYVVSLVPLVVFIRWIRSGNSPATAGLGLVAYALLIVTTTNLLTGGQSIGANIALPTITLLAVMFSPPRLAWAWLALALAEIAFSAWLRNSDIIFPIRPDPDWVRSSIDRIPFFFSIGSGLIGWMVIRALRRFRSEFVASRLAEAEAEARAATSADRFTDFAEVAADGFWETDLDLQLTFVSPNFAEAMGMEAKDMLGLTPGEAYLRRFPGISGVDGFMEPLIRRKSFKDLLFPAKDGNDVTRWLRCLGRPTFDKDGEFIGYRGVVRDVTAQLTYERELERSERQLRLITESIPALVAYLDRDVRYRFCNPLACEVLGMPVEEVLGRTMREVRGEAIYAGLRNHVEQVLRGEPVSFEGEGLWDGRHYHFQTTYVPDRSQDGALRGFFAVTFDITDLKTSTLELQETSERLRLITDSVPAHIYHLDAEKRFTFSNQVFRDMGAGELDQVTARHVSELYGSTTFSELQPILDRAYGGETVTAEIELNGKALRAIFVPDNAGEPEARGVYGLVSDITELKRVESELRRLAQFDTLTGLGNRRRFQEQLDMALARNKRSDGMLGLMFLDIDRFKQINDSLGHEAGDIFLKTFAKRVVSSVRQVDAVCRLAGDEFVVILENLGGRDDAEAVARKIQRSLTQPLELDGTPVAMSATIGIAFAADEGTAGEDLLRRADEALYVAKKRERGSYEFASS